MTKRVVIIGSGPGGLASAMLLAKAGLDVTVYERSNHVGGRTTALEFDGFRFDVGPTFFLFPQVLEDIFRACGYDLRREVPMRQLDPQYRLIFEQGGRIDATPDVARMRSAIAAIAPRDAENLESYLADNRAKLAAFTPCLERPYESWRDVLTPQMLKLLPVLRPWNSVDRELRRYFSDERVRLAFSFQSKYLGMSPYKCPGLFTILSFLEYEHGVFHPLGGCSAITRRMGELARQLGAKIETGVAVEEIVFNGVKAVGVKTTSGQAPADAVVVNSDFAQTIRRLIPQALRRRWSDDRIASKRYSCSTFMMYLAIDGALPELAHHNIFLAGDYRQNLYDIEQGHVLSTNPSFYVQNACVKDPSLAPDGCSTLYVLAPVSHQHRNINWRQSGEAFQRLMFSQLEKIGLKNIAQRVRGQRLITPDDWQEKMHIFKGATFNLAHDFGQMLHLRPHNRFEEVEGVYLVGGGTHPGSGLPVIFESAKISSRLLLEDMNVGSRWHAMSRSVGEPAVPQTFSGAAIST